MKTRRCNIGYRSNVYIKIRKKEVLKTNHFLDNYKQEFDVDLRKKEQISHCDDFIYIELTDWKFYESYPMVTAIVDFVESLGESAGMIAIGEDDAPNSWGDTYMVDLYTITEIEGMN